MVKNMVTKEQKRKADAHITDAIDHIGEERELLGVEDPEDREGTLRALGEKLWDAQLDLDEAETLLNELGD